MSITFKTFLSMSSASNKKNLDEAVFEGLFSKKIKLIDGNFYLNYINDADKISIINTKEPLTSLAQAEYYLKQQTQAETNVGIKNILKKSKISTGADLKKQDSKQYE